MKAVDALLELVVFDRSDKRDRRHESFLDNLLFLTAQRSNNTAFAISNLLRLGSIAQSQMLTRSLFEDMAVLHWVIMQDDHLFLAKRFFDSQDAIVLAEHTHTTEKMGLPYSMPAFIRDPEKLLERAAELRREFGQSAQKPWWGITHDGKSRNLAEIVAEVGKYEDFKPRLNGKEPALANFYALSNSWANQALHHTPRGLPYVLTRDGGVFTPDLDTYRHMVAYTAFWCLGQTLLVSYGYGCDSPDLARDFHERFTSLLKEEFAEGKTDDEVAASLAETRAQIDPGGGEDQSTR